ncbi:hypothetical protein FNV43_RR06760 [Rhamnella rubrinervis]|uniref:Disease resistance protein RGA3 n=1 Tax=Rhamnella rubrinervis TaxID=2594499 RepID=A0A8K0HE03_9ROSA|nr:hypothetical protein FNV43_RR06760 [Rhamnella rubrinervis]
MAVDGIVSVLLDQLLSIVRQQVEPGIRLVMGVENEVSNLESNLQAVGAVLVDAEKRQLKEMEVRRWLDELKDVSYEIDDVLDEWSTAILKSNLENGVQTARSISKKKVCFSLLFPCCPSSQTSHVGYRLDIAHKIKSLNGRLDDIAIRRDRYNFSPSINAMNELERPRTTSIVDVSKILGRDKEEENLISKLLCATASGQERDLLIIPIVGMGGIGKTTLAQLVYNNNAVKAHFDKRIWVCVSDPFDEAKIVKTIIEQLTGQEPKLVDLEALLQRLIESISDKKFFLVLDDVWTYDYQRWEPLKQTLELYGGLGSRVLLTTRMKKVGIRMGEPDHLIELEKLSEEECWLLFSQAAFSRKDKKHEELKEIGRKIAAKCGGLPLAAKTVGSHMYFKTSTKEWQDVLDSELWDLEDADMNLFSPLLLSYYDLSPEVKRCFAYCAIFPKDALIDRDDLIHQWISQGIFDLKKNIMEKEVAALKCFENLAMRSFFQDFVSDVEWNTVRCKMHDIVHDFAQFLSRNESSISTNESIQDIYGRKTRHLNLMFQAETNDSLPLLKSRYLRTLVVSNIVAMRPYEFVHPTCLRTLNLSRCLIKELPENIDALIHLRYLNLSHNLELKELPSRIGNLCNLQTLRLLHCYSLERLPETVGKLIRLRNLFTFASYRLRWLPKGIGRLSSLGMINEFRVPNGGNEEAFKLGDLRKLTNLQQLYIRGLGDARDHVEEAKQAPVLENNKELLNLTLYFSSSRREIHEDVLEALKPHSNLESLRIAFYEGFTVSPSWLMSLTSLKRLVMLDSSCEVLPPLGRLPSLETLEILALERVEKVGAEFLGVEIDDGGHLSNSSSSSITLFPKLKKLRFERMDELREWVGITSSTPLRIMPRLNSLEFVSCISMEALPDFLPTIPLQNLIIQCSWTLEDCCEKETGKEWTKVSHIPNIQIEASLWGQQRG